VPLYRQVEMDLNRRIKAGEWPPGAKIPSEPVLCAQYSVSRVTMREAVTRLVQHGLLRKEQGRGTFVREPQLVAEARRLTSLSEELGVLGLQSGASVLSSRITTAGETETSGQLRLLDTAGVFELRRLRTASGAPLGIQTAILPLNRFPGIESVDLEDHSLYAILRERYGVVAQQAFETFTVGMATSEERGLLELPRGIPVFHVKRLSYDAEGPFEFVTSVMRGDRYQVRLHLHHT
jgi:GntR family transcriptional regulator